MTKRNLKKKLECQRKEEKNMKNNKKIDLFFIYYLCKFKLLK